jgi:hypothetical protein
MKKKTKSVSDTELLNPKKFKRLPRGSVWLRRETRTSKREGTNFNSD